MASTKEKEISFDKEKGKLYFDIGDLEEDETINFIEAEAYKIIEKIFCKKK